jgi:hypothetical protein
VVWGSPIQNLRFPWAPEQDKGHFQWLTFGPKVNFSIISSTFAVTSPPLSTKYKVKQPTTDQCLLLFAAALHDLAAFLLTQQEVLMISSNLAGFMILWVEHVCQKLLLWLIAFHLPFLPVINNHCIIHNNLHLHLVSPQIMMLPSPSLLRFFSISPHLLVRLSKWVHHEFFYFKHVLPTAISNGKLWSTTPQMFCWSDVCLAGVPTLNSGCWRCDAQKRRLPKNPSAVLHILCKRLGGAHGIGTGWVTYSGTHWQALFSGPKKTGKH